MVDDALKISIVVDKTVILYKEYLYTESVLDVLYAKVVAHKVDSAVVIYKGILSRNSFIESYKVFNFTINNALYDCYLSKFDVNKIINLLKMAGIKDIRILDKFGYFVTLNKIKYKDCCMIDTIGNAYMVITFLDKIRDIVYNKYSNLEKILINNNKRYAISKFLDMTTYFDEDLLRYFKNSDAILKELKSAEAVSAGDVGETTEGATEIIRVLSALSVFAFAELPGSKYFEIDVNKLNLIGANPIREKDDFTDESIEETESELEQGTQGTVDFDIDKELLKAEQSRNGVADSSDDSTQEIQKSLAKDVTTEEHGAAEGEQVTAEKQVKGKGKSSSSKVMVAVNVASILLSMSMLAGTFFAENVANTYEEKIGVANEQYESNLSSIDSVNSALTEYEHFSQDLQNVAPYGSLYSKLISVNNKMKIDTVTFDGDTMNARFMLPAKNKKAQKKLTEKVVKQLGKDFVVQSYTTSVDKKDLQFNTYLGQK